MAAIMIAALVLAAAVIIVGYVTPAIKEWLRRRAVVRRSVADQQLPGHGRGSAALPAGLEGLPREVRRRQSTLRGEKVPNVTVTCDAPAPSP